MAIFFFFISRNVYVKWGKIKRKGFDYRKLLCKKNESKFSSDHFR